MSRSTSSSGFVPVMRLLEKRLPAYLVGVLLRGLTLAYCFNLVMAFVFQDVLNASMSGDMTLWTRGVVLALATFVLGTPIVCVGWYVLVRAVYWQLAAVRSRFYTRLAKAPLDCVERHHSGDLVSRCTSDLSVVTGMYAEIAGSAQGISMGILGIGALVALDWRLGAAGMSIGLLYLATSFGFARILRRQSDATQAAQSALVQRLSDLLAGFLTTRMFQREDAVTGQCSDAAQAVAERRIAVGRTKAAHGAVQELLEWLATMGVLALALVLFGRGVLLVGAVWAAVRLQGNASALFNSVGGYITGLQRGLAGGRRILEVLAWPDESSPVELAPASLAAAGPIVSLRNVSYAYDDRAQALDDVTLDVAAGERVALVGESGGGKSTLLKLLLGFYPGYAGSIAVGGKELRQQPLSAVRDLVAYVPQDAYLFDGTIADNIGFGKPGATRDDIVACAKAAHAHEFILQQPEGYDTHVGERGAKLSGGQRQRIAIARALLKDAPILLLDEATSALDAESESLVQDALARLAKRRTTIAVAHRLSTVSSADRIYVIERGRLVESGSHGELLEMDGAYARLLRTSVVVPAGA